MKKIDFRSITWSLFLLILGGIMFILNRIEIAIILILLGLFGVSWKEYIKKSKIIKNSTKEKNIKFLFFVIFVIIYFIIKYYLFNKEILGGNILGALIGLLIIYIYIQFIVPRISPSEKSKELSRSERLNLVLLLLIMLPMIPLFIITIGKIILSQNISPEIILIDVTLIICLIFLIYKIKNKNTIFGHNLF